MHDNFVEEQAFKKIDFTKNPLPKGVYEYCTFQNCDLSNADLSESRFMECEFSACNLSNAKLIKTSFQDVKFKFCKMLGMRFEDCKNLGLAIFFEDCQLNHSSFYQLKLKGTIFKNSVLQETDFTECDLSNSIFENSDMLGATFENTNLEKTHFKTSFNYSINPNLNRVKKARFSLEGIAGLLESFDIEID